MNIEFKRLEANKGKLIFEAEEIGSFLDIREHFSIRQKNFGYIKSCRMRKIKVKPDKEFISKSCIKLNGEFDLGLLHDIFSFIKQKFSERVLNFKIDEGTREYIKGNNLDLILDISIGKDMKLRDYQIESMQIALNKKNGIFLMGTGAGKTACTSLIANNFIKHKLSSKVLIICPSPDLVLQTASEMNLHLSEEKYLITPWTGKKPINLESNIIVAGSDILLSRFKEYKKDLLQINAIIVDEVHTLKSSNKVSKIIREFKSEYKIGFTGTLPDKQEDVWSVKGIIGPVRYEKPSAELRDNNFLTPVSVYGLNMNLSNVPTKIYDDDGNAQPFSYTDELEWLHKNQEFNSNISKILDKISGNTLLLFTHLAHCDSLEKNCTNYCKNKKILVIQGETPFDQRADIKAQLEKENNLIVIAQASIFSTGINVKNLPNLVFPGVLGKSGVRIVQSIGRILRLAEGKQKAKVYDIVPNTKYCQKHWEQRKLIYSKEKIDFKEITIK